MILVIIYNPTIFNKSKLFLDIQFYVYNSGFYIQKFRGDYFKNDEIQSGFKDKLDSKGEIR